MASSLREALEAAMSGEGAAPEPEITAPEPPAADASSPAEAAPDAAAPAGEKTPENAAPQAEDGAQPRSPDGKFAKKAEAEQSAPSATAPVAEPDPPQEPIRVPPSLPAALKAKFAELPTEWREAFLKRDEDVSQAKAQWDAKAARFNRFDEIIAPRREKLQLAGLDEFSAIQTLFAAQDLLERSPLEGLQYLARSYGVDLRQLGAQTSQPGQGHQPQPGQPSMAALEPFFVQALQPLASQVQTLQQQLMQRDEAARQAELNQGIAEVNAFRSDPKNLYFDNVKDHVLILLQSGAAQTLQDAYDQACWANSEIRGLLLSAQQQDQQRQAAAQSAEAQRAAQAAQQAKAAASAKAAGSVTGAPGSTVAPPTGSKGNLRADLLAAMGEHRPQV